MGSDRRRYIHNMARNLAGSFGVSAQTYDSHESKQSLAHELFKDRFSDVFAWVYCLNDDTKGRLAVCGEGLMPSNHPTSQKNILLIEVVPQPVYPWLNDKMNGDWLVTKIAAVAVLAAMADNFWADLSGIRADKLAKKIRADLGITPVPRSRMFD